MDKLICFFLNIGDILDLSFSSGRSKRYEVIETQILSDTETAPSVSESGDQVTLVTQFPFDIPSGGRHTLYMVVARRVPDSTSILKKSKILSELK